MSEVPLYWVVPSSWPSSMPTRRNPCGAASTDLLNWSGFGVLLLLLLLSTTLQKSHNCAVVSRRARSRGS